MTSYKALTLSQPYATLLALGQKRIETRSWSTSFRGPLLIHAGAGLGPVGGAQGLMELCRSEPFRSILLAAGILGAPLTGGMRHAATARAGLDRRRARRLEATGAGLVSDGVRAMGAHQLQADAARGVLGPGGALPFIGQARPLTSTHG